MMAGDDLQTVVEKHEPTTRHISLLDFWVAGGDWCPLVLYVAVADVGLLRAGC